MRARPIAHNPSQLALWGPAPAAPGGPVQLPMPEADVRFFEAFLSPSEAKALHQALIVTAPWKQSRRVMFGRDVAVPRMTAWYGDPGFHYELDEGRIAPEPWTEALGALKARVEAAVAARFNAVLLNRYRDGRDGVAWHSDYEVLFGPRPVIGLLSLGATRRFMFRPKPGREGHTLSLALESGSLLVMAGGTQTHWEHCVTKTSQDVGERISLTFRLMRGALGGPAKE